ncbi:cytochrome-c peroxidase [Sediminitomix flava]|uniref:Cytochrome c peroxidase n=1 Tax=Sediminitomix flava TaxID=379075 RepID=A0A315ZDZ0_SEDFL|nr:cytochrome c peroxidase [Sediminitomix flava]PWJ43349.1 cytochrome c peroxidase [Sediminitomix flava]
MKASMKLSIATCLLLTCMFGCSDDDDGNTTTSSSQLDEQLEEQLMVSSSGAGMSFYILPESDDYNNIPQDPNNPITRAKCDLGQLLFHETALAIVPKKEISRNTYSCASCHHAAAGFQAGRMQGIGEGGLGFGIAGEGRSAHLEYVDSLLDVQPLRSPTAMNGAYQKNMLWNGQFGATGKNIGTEAQWKEGTPIATNKLGFEGLETQAIAGLGVHRLSINDSILDDHNYREMFDAAFPNDPVSDRYSLTNVGLAIACYERTLMANESGFQKWLKGDKTALSDAEKRGALVFFGKGECYSCHNGPALNTMEFTAIGMGDLEGALVRGAEDEKANLGRGGFTGNDADKYKFKVPQLYNLKDSPFYGHGSTFKTIRQVIEYKNKGEVQNANVTEQYLDSRFKPLNLTSDEIDDLVKFCEYALWDDNLKRYEPETIPSGMCFPNNDAQSKSDMNCD